METTAVSPRSRLSALLDLVWLITLLPLPIVAVLNVMGIFTSPPK